MRSTCPLLAEARLLRLEVIRHKPGRRGLIAYEFETRDGGRRRVLGKVRAKGLDRKTFEAVQDLRAHGFDESAPDLICIPPALGVVPRWNMWVQAEVPGVPATGALLHGDDGDLPARIAAAAFKLHRTSVVPPRAHTMERELEILQKRLGEVARAQPPLSERIARLLAECDRLAATLGPPEARPIHRDFHPAQVLVDGARLWLLDLDLFSAGEPAIDVGNFIAHVTELSLRTFGDASRRDDIARGIEDAYVSAAGEHTRASVRVLTILSLARHVWISTLFEDRREFTERLLALCEARAGDH